MIKYGVDEMKSYSTITTETESRLSVQEYNLRKKLLILDLDETLISSTFDEPSIYDFSMPIMFEGEEYPIFIRKRPGLDQFLETIINIYEVVIFTASMPEYSIPIIQKIIPSFPKKNILTRQHCKFFNGVFIKDLSIFGRQLSDVLIVDDKSSSYCFQPNNGIKISTWTGDQHDSELLTHILPLLLMCSTVDDVRVPLSTAKRFAM